MEEPNLTTSAIIGFSVKLEDDSSQFYEELAKRYVDDIETLRSFSKESLNNRILVTRTYQETITDALEACFSFKGLSLSNYLADMALKDDMTYYSALKLAIELEEKAIKFYLDVADRSKSLLATIPNAFRKVAERRNKRKLKIESLLGRLE